MDSILLVYLQYRTKRFFLRMYLLCQAVQRIFSNGEFIFEPKRWREVPVSDWYNIFPAKGINGGVGAVLDSNGGKLYMLVAELPGRGY